MWLDLITASDTVRLPVCVSSHQQIQQLRASVSAVASGASPRRGGGRVQKQLVVLKRVDQTGNVAHKSLGLFGRHSFGESLTLQGEIDCEAQSVWAELHRTENNYCF